MFKIGLILLSITSYAFAQLPIGDVTRLNIFYNEPSGRATAGVFEFGEFKLPENSVFSVEKQAGVFMLETPDQHIAISGLPESITSLSSLEVENLNLSTKEEKMSFSLQRLTGSSSESKLKLREFSITCNAKRIKNDSPQQVLDACINEDGKAKIQLLKIDGETVLSSTSISINQNQLKFRIKSGGFNVKGNGKAFYQDQIIRIKVEKAKVGALNVKRRLFKKLREIESDRVTLNNPWIEIDLK